MRLTLHYRDHSEEKPLDLDTVLIETDEQRLTLTWRASADTHGDPFRLLEMIIGEVSEQGTANSNIIDSGRRESEGRQSLS